MLSYLATDPKIRIMQKIMKTIEKDLKKIENSNHSKLNKFQLQYEKELDSYNIKIKQHGLKINQVSAPSRINRHVAAIVAYSELRKAILNLLKTIKTRKKHRLIKSKGLLKYT